MDLAGKVAVVTGGARGLGQAYCVALARAGAAVVAADKRDCAETVRLVNAAGGQALGLALDVADLASCRAMATAAGDAFGGIDILVNNAALYGSLKMGKFESLDDGEWDACMTVNVKGIWNCCRAVVPVMRRSGGGRIINIASAAALYGMAFGLHYMTSKAAVIGMTRGLARELGRDNILVNAVAPTMVMTEATGEFFEGALEKAAEGTRQIQVIRRSAETDDLTGVILFLAGSASKMMTGQVLSVDGGLVFN